MTAAWAAVFVLCGSFAGGWIFGASQRRADSSLCFGMTNLRVPNFVEQKIAIERQKWASRNARPCTCADDSRFSRPVSAIKRAVLDGFGDVFGFQVGNGFQVGDGSGDF